MKSNLTVKFIAVVIVTFCCYLPDLNNRLLEWDDALCITRNVQIHSFNINTIIWAFTTFHNNCWTPFTWISLAVDYAFWGNNPIGYHLSNNIIHALNSGMFFLLSYYLIKAYEQGDHRRDIKLNYLKSNKAVYCSLFAALFFSIHPLRVESVVWAIARKDVLSSFFGIATFIAYIKHVKFMDQKPTGTNESYAFIYSINYWLAFCLLCFSLLSKSMLVTLPLSLLILDWFPLKRYIFTKKINLVYEKIPFCIPIVITSILNLYSIRSIMSESEHISLLTRFLIACKSLVSYLWLTIWPVNISPFYPHPGNNIIYSEYIMPIMSILVISIVVSLLVQHYPALMASWLFYLVTLLPTLGFTTFGSTSTATRFTYFPSLSIALLVSLGLLVIINKSSNSLQLFLVILLVIILPLIFYGKITLKQIPFWKDDLTLWTRVLELQAKERQPIANNWIVHGNIGAALLYKGKLIEAYPHLLEAARIKPTDHVSYVNLGTYYSKMRQPEMAIGSFKKALQIEPDQEEALYRLGIAYCYIGDHLQSRNTLYRLQSIVPDRARQLSGLLRGAGCLKD